jgi:hypothetical protein
LSLFSVDKIFVRTANNFAIVVATMTQMQMIIRWTFYYHCWTKLFLTTDCFCMKTQYKCISKWQLGLLRPSEINIHFLSPR